MALFELFRKQTANWKNDVLSGLTVALALVPEAVAFAFVADIPPIVGLYGAFMMGLVTAIFGGRPGMISGATGALAVVMVDLVREARIDHPDIAAAGLQFLFATIVLAGLIQMAAGFLKLGKFVRLIPRPVMMGFVNGLAIVIFTSQLGMLPVSDGSFLEVIQRPQLWTMLGLIGLTMAIMIGLPKLTKKVPAGLVAILAVSLLVIFSGIETDTVLSFVQSKSGADASIKGTLPSFLIPNIPITWESLKFITPYALILAAIGLIESLMTLQLIDDITETRGNGNKECIAQGAGNILNGFFGGMGGCAMIGQSIINVNSGGRMRLSGIVAALTLLSFILFLSSYIEMVPIAALVGVMFMVVIGTFAWSSFRIIRKIPLADAVVLIAVSVITVLADLAVAVICGVIISALVFAWNNAKRIRARKTMKDDGTKSYEIFGPLFFGSTQAFLEKFDYRNDPDTIEIDFIDSKVADQSGVEALKSVIEKYLDADKQVRLIHLSPDCKQILNKMDPRFDKYIKETVNDPRYYVVTDSPTLG